jgi:hypothetical protein
VEAGAPADGRTQEGSVCGRPNRLMLLRTAWASLCRAFHIGVLTSPSVSLAQIEMCSFVYSGAFLEGLGCCCSPPTVDRWLGETERHLQPARSVPTRALVSYKSEQVCHKGDQLQQPLNKPQVKNEGRSSCI